MKSKISGLKLAKIFIVCLAALFAVGCASGAEKDTARSTVESYFTYLRNGEFDNANALCVLNDDTLLTSDVEDSEINRFLFEKAEYSVSAINTEKEKGLYADIVVTQRSVYNVYASTAKEYSEYIKNAEKEGKSFSEEALNKKFDALLLENLKNDDTFISKKVRVYISSEGKILMDSQFRNILFGGELDAINDLSKIK